MKKSADPGSVTSFSMVIVVMSLRLRGFTNSDLTWGMASVLGFCAAEANLAVLVGELPAHSEIMSLTISSLCAIDATSLPKILEDNQCQLVKGLTS